MILHERIEPFTLPGDRLINDRDDRRAVAHDDVLHAVMIELVTGHCETIGEIHPDSAITDEPDHRVIKIDLVEQVACQG